MTHESISMPSHAAMREQLRAASAAMRTPVEVTLIQARLIARVLAYHADLGREWGEKFQDLCEQALDVLAKLEEEDNV